MNILINDDFRNHINMFPQDCYVISDPPYNQKYHYSEYGDSMDINSYKEMLNAAFGNRKAVVVHYPEETINILGKILGNCEQVVSWIYNSNTAKQSRLISWWNCKPDLRKIPQPYKNQTDKRIIERILAGKTCRAYDWWEINQVKNVSKQTNPHPCPIPYELARRIIVSTTSEGDTIIDPFAGSGTTLLAAKNTNRNYLGFEIDKKYCDYFNNLNTIDKLSKVC